MGIYINGVSPIIRSVVSNLFMLRAIGMVLDLEKDMIQTLQPNLPSGFMSSTSHFFLAWDGNSYPRPARRPAAAPPAQAQAQQVQHTPTPVLQRPPVGQAPVRGPRDPLMTGTCWDPGGSQRWVRNKRKDDLGTGWCPPVM